MLTVDSTESTCHCQSLDIIWVQTDAWITSEFKLHALHRFYGYFKRRVGQKAFRICSRTFGKNWVSRWKNNYPEWHALL